jgi:hypothetical protein
MNNTISELTNYVHHEKRILKANVSAHGRSLRHLRNRRLAAFSKRVVARLGVCLACGDTNEYFVYDAERHTPKQARIVFAHYKQELCRVL